MFGFITSRRFKALVWTVMLAITALIATFVVIGVHYRTKWYPQNVTKDLRKRISERMDFFKSKKPSKLFDFNEEPLGVFARHKTAWPHEKDIVSQPVTKAILLSEGDIAYNQCKGRLGCMVLTPLMKYFIEIFHPGKKKLNCQPLSPDGILRAFYNSARGRQSGGSNAVNQAAKNFFKFGRKVSGGKYVTIKYKFTEELARSIILCEQYSREDVLRAYYTTMYTGYRNRYGLRRLTQYYFSKQPKELGFYEGVMVAASLPNPKNFNPWTLQTCRENDWSKCPRKARGRKGRKWHWYKNWRKRIRHIIKNLRHNLKSADKVVFEQELKQNGHHNDLGKPFGMSLFQNGLKKDKIGLVLSSTSKHGIHLRKWTVHDLRKAKLAQLASGGYNISLTYAKKLRKSIHQVRNEIVVTLREKLKQGAHTKSDDKVQVAFTIANAQDGAELVRDGGTSYVDLNSRKKSGMGSVYKIMTLLILSQYWHDGIPMLNYGQNLKAHCSKGVEKCTQVRPFYGTEIYRAGLYRPKNDHGMRKYVDKIRALTKSANIGFVFMTTRYMLLLNAEQRLRIARIALQSMYKRKFPKTSTAAVLDIVKAMLSPGGFSKLNRFIQRHWDPRMLRDPSQRRKAAFEAAKTATIQHFRSQIPVYSDSAGFSALGISLAELAGTNPSGSLGADIGADVQAVFKQKLTEYQSMYASGSPVTVQEALYYPRLSIELGLRYVEYLARRIMGVKYKKHDGWDASPGMTLGQGIFTIRNMLRIPALVISEGGGGLPYLVRVVERSEKQDVLYDYATQKAHKRSWAKMIDSKSYVVVKKAMQSVASAGTAYKAYKYVKKHFGDKFSSIRVGFKTGTANELRGVSCAGFLEDTSQSPPLRLAGALTISIPSNKSLSACRYSGERTYRLCLGKGRYKKLRQSGMIGRRARKGGSIGSWRACLALATFLAHSHEFIINNSSLKVKLADSVIEYMKKKAAAAKVPSKPGEPEDDGYEFDPGNSDLDDDNAASNTSSPPSRRSNQ